MTEGLTLGFQLDIGCSKLSLKQIYLSSRRNCECLISTGICNNGEDNSTEK